MLSTKANHGTVHTDWEPGHETFCIVFGDLARLAPRKEKRRRRQVWHCESRLVLYGNGRRVRGPLPISSLPSPLLVIFNSSLFLLCRTRPVLVQEHHRKMLWGLGRTCPSIQGATLATQGNAQACRPRRADPNLGQGAAPPNFGWNLSFFTFLEPPQQKINCSMIAKIKCLMFLRTFKHSSFFFPHLIFNVAIFYKYKSNLGWLWNI